MAKASDFILVPIPNTDDIVRNTTISNDAVLDAVSDPMHPGGACPISRFIINQSRQGNIEHVEKRLRLDRIYNR
jgi:hypothetical protein